MEDDGGSPLVTPVSAELRAAQRRIVIHLEKAYGIKAKKVKLLYSLYCSSVETLEIQLFGDFGLKNQLNE